jgi:MoxR-like ATPase
LQHFHDAQFRKEASAIDRYVTFEALGLAILASASSADSGIHLPRDLRDRAPLRSVVLIDEIDKAPRDLPNDVLDEVESMSFTVKETGRTFSADRRYKPIVILTSNSEKTLPDAFLRRCVFFHLTFPSGDRLMEIARRRLGPSRFDDENIKLAIRHFEEIRSLALRKKPSTAELIAWLRVLDSLDVMFHSGLATNRDALVMSYAVLAKNKDDIAVLADRIAQDRRL